MAQASRVTSHVEENMANNELLEIWTLSWGLSVIPWFEKDKLHFKCLKKGEHGAGMSVYMDTQRDGATCFDDWAYDILHDRRFERIMHEELQAGEKYPRHYRYVTGEKGQKTLGIANSQKGGYVINMTVPDEQGKMQYCNIPVTFHDLRKLAERYEIAYAPRRKQLERIREEAELKAMQYHTNRETDVEQADTTPVPQMPVEQQPPAEDDVSAIF